MKWKKLWRELLFPHMAVMLVLLFISTAFLVYAMVFLDTGSVPAIISYVLAAYTLTVWCLRIPRFLRSYKTFEKENKYIQLWQNDTRLRMNVSLYGTLIWNAAYAVLQLGLGLWHRTFWFGSLSGYYISLAVMRFFLVRHTRRHAPGKQMRAELLKYRACGIVFLVMNLSLSLMIFFMVYWNRTFVHHEITTIAMAAYTFVSFAMAIRNVIRYRKLGSPVYSASKAISLASACVSMLTLESTMLTTFGDGTMDLASRRIMLGASGGVISVFIIAMAIYMIVGATKKLKQLDKTER